MRTYPLGRLILTLVALSVFSCLSLSATERWIEQRDPQFGYSYSYPEALFAENETPEWIGPHNSHFS